MPLVRISIPAHLADEKARALADAVHGALISTCNITANELFQLISRFSAANMRIDPTFPDVERTADASIVEITLLAGRNDDKNRSLYRAIAAGAVAAGFRSDDVMVAMIENGSIDLSLGRVEAYDKHGSG